MATALRPTLRAALVLLATAPLLVVPDASFAKDDGLDEAARRDAASRGVAYLEKELPRLPDSAGTPRKPFTQAIAGLCFLLDDTGRTSDADRARVTKVKDALLRYLDDVALRIDDPEEIPARHGVFESDHLIQYTWPVAAAGLFFGELHERGLHKADARDALATVVELLVRSQQANGGWGHHIVSGADGGAEGDAGPRLPKDLEDRLGPDVADRFRRASRSASGYPDTLVSSSNLVGGTLGLLQGVLGKRAVDGLPAARRYFREAPLENGAYPYDPSQRSATRDATAPGRTAGALWAWQTLGMRRDDRWTLSRNYLLERLEDVSEGHGSPCLNVLYAALATQAMGADEFRTFRIENEPRIIATQNPEDGSLHCICGQKHMAVTCDSRNPFGAGAAAGARGQAVYTTALHTLVLLLPGKGLRITKRTPKAGASEPAVTPR